jgi:7-cyano-7-deazaguanine synthase
MSDEQGPGRVILLSGGLDSTVLLYHRHQLSQARALFPLFIDYAQRALYHERRAAEFHCAKLGLELQILDLSSAGRDFRSFSGVNLHVPVPHRNLPLLSFAVSYAALKGCDTVELGVIADDLDQDKAFSLEFWRAFAQVAGSLGQRLELPFVGRSKGWVVALGRELGVDFDVTFSCICGVDRACGRCRQCRQRRAAFESLGNGSEDERE